jgi:hypothetical protein
MRACVSVQQGQRRRMDQLKSYGTQNFPQSYSFRSAIGNSLLFNFTFSINTFRLTSY